MGILDESLKSAIDRPKYEGFNDCACITFHILHSEKEALMEKLSSGVYWTQEEQFYLSKIEMLMQKLDKKYKKFRY